MTAPDLGASWLRSVPGRITRRDVSLCTVTALLDGYFSARVQGDRRRQYFDLRLVSDDEKALLKPGAKFWLVAEWTRPGEVTSAIALRRGGESAEAAFGVRADAGVER